MRIDTLEHLLLNDPEFTESWMKQEMEAAENYFKSQVFDIEDYEVSTVHKQRTEK